MSPSRDGRSASPQASLSPPHRDRRSRSLSRSPVPPHRDRPSRSLSRSPVPPHRDRRSRSLSRSPVPPHRDRRSRSLSRSPHRSRSRSRDSVDVTNPGNNLYVTGLSTRVNTGDLEKFFNKEGKVTECHLVTDPRTKESRGFAFVTMETNEDADRCIKYLNRSVLEGRLITVEKAKRKRGRTPTPGRYQGLRGRRGYGPRRSRSRSPHRRHDRDPYHRDRRGRPSSPYGRRGDDYGHHGRQRDRRSLSPGVRGYSRAY